MLESDFKKQFLERVKARIGTKVDLDIITTDPTNNRSIPDTILLGARGRWAALEFKKHRRSKRQPNQSYHVARMDLKSYARFVDPSNGDKVLNELEELFLS